MGLVSGEGKKREKEKEREAAILAVIENSSSRGAFFGIDSLSVSVFFPLLSSEESVSLV